ncbi:hypothetical protein [Streptomyces sp. HUAS TT20]|uniref:hypothetical protein n=1 Tax=Streptomyces sp. HUAS TT20 TaxID=3447509 RepID=UPI0021D93761|nr:hypothetical protein [Streptomyces sp. HUAS 15-9]UXY32889.1 hypothetical protein N8I87_40640 [Streptomyces sp. HUAS 15-9]
MAHAAGATLKDIQEMLGHSSITITADTYTSLLPEADLAIAEAAGRLVPRARTATENTAPKAVPEADGAEKPGPESCRMVLIRSVSFGRSTPRPLTHRSHKRPRTRRPRPNRAPPWVRNRRSAAYALCPRRGTRQMGTGAGGGRRDHGSSWSPLCTSEVTRTCGDGYRSGSDGQARRTAVGVRRWRPVPVQVVAAARLG